MADCCDSALLTDLYQLTMLQGYFRQGMEDTAVFEFFSRKLPPKRNFFLMAGLQQVLDYLETLQFATEEIQWLRSTGRFDSDFLDYLADLRFQGDVYAMPEGTICFPDEPMLRIVAPLPQAQLVESRIINLLQFQTLIASKAVRCVLTAPDKLLVDFGFRRAHGAEAGLLAARASYLAGFHGTATVLAGKQFGIPIFGTMAHSFVEAHENEKAAFAHFARAQPDNVVLLIDTYDTLQAARKVVELAQELRQQGIAVKGVRLDSGDLAREAVKVREILDLAGLREITIFSSGSMDEYALRDLLIRQKAPIDGFGIGTRLDTSADAPYLDCAYKLQEYAGRARRKLSTGKKTWPGRKQVFRQFTDAGRMEQDVLALETEQPAGEPLLELAMRHGRRVTEQKPLREIRDYAARQLATLPEAWRQLEPAPAFPVQISAGLQQLAEEVDQWILSRNKLQ